MTKTLMNRVKSRKQGTEDILIMRIPSERFQKHLPQNFNPPSDDKSRYQIALLAQSCIKNSFDDEEAGPTDDFHFWLRLPSSDADPKVTGADFMLPSMQWFGLASATSNDVARNNLQTFGFNPLNLKKSDLQEKGGSLTFSNGEMIEWTFTGSGKRFNSVGVNHEIFVSGNRQDSNGHHISALISNAVMDMLGRVYIQTAALEPFLLEGEKIPAAVHRMHKLEADIIFKKISKY